MTTHETIRERVKNFPSYSLNQNISRQNRARIQKELVEILREQQDGSRMFRIGWQGGQENFKNLPWYKRLFTFLIK